MITVKLGDKITAKKPHACGGYIWEVTRVGADIRLKCEKCGHNVFVSHDKLMKMTKTQIGEING